MIIVDSTVWIDFFNGKTTRETDLLATLLEKNQVGIGDLILAEVLQGFRLQGDYNLAKGHLSFLPCFEMTGKTLAIKSAENYRMLRNKGITIRKTIDMFIATFCIENGHTLLHNDRDFDPMVSHLGLKVL
ncbi:MAG: PIN domain nuclease [Bacteroidia bacterium]|nr:PIN domain nuclease [Bacteroidia bacterium]